ncbi:disease resistance protein RPM1-like [Miscanthus floridulus]|uniref:disease resistance protein RPM1-like n=1 Tax=Miscanthus floridulus TaxID=154761 RepID=UPI0034574195
MAEGVVGWLIPKLGDALANEAVEVAYSFFGVEGYALKGLFREIRDVKGELESVQAFLCAAERFRDTDETTVAFVKQIRSLAYEIEDVIAECTYHLGEDADCMFLFKPVRRIRQIKVWYRLAKRLQDTKLGLKNAAERRGRYELKGIERGTRLSGSSSSNWKCSGYMQFKREEDLVGIKKERDFLLEWVKDNDQRNMIASVLGMGGIGKTTLVAHIYSAVKEDFDTCAWITVSQRYEVDDLLRQIVREFRKNDRRKDFPEDVDVTDYRSLPDIICSYLKNKRYILVLDDVWNVNVLFDSKETFLGGNGRIILTSRIYEVARLAHESNIVHLQPLQERDAQYLFYKEAFWKNKDMACPHEVEHWAKMFVEKCNGLPIAIVCIGRFLSFRRTSYLEWEKVYKGIEMRLSNNPIMDMNIILQVSLEDLPHNIRNCFLYCCLYPENYVMQRKSLVRLWVAEGFVEKIGQKTLEEIAEDHLTELIHRCLLVVVKRNDSGCVCEVQMHDILRVLALSKSHEENFGSVYNPLKTDLIREARRVSTESGDIARVAENAPHLRSLLVFQNSFTPVSLRSLSSVNKLLSVLNLQDSSIEWLPKEVFDLYNLRFLGLRRTNIASLPRLIGRLKNLLVLDAWKCKITELPSEVTKLHKLTHLIITSKPVRSSLQFVPSVGVHAPANICSLTRLQTLLLMEASAEVVCSIGTLVELRTFRISKVQGSHCENLFKAISNMTHLTRLGIQAADNEEMVDLKALQPPPLLQKLFLLGALSKETLPGFFSSLGNLKNITFLRLVGSRLDENTFSCLKGLQWLVKLQLYDAYSGGKMLFSTESFPNLKVLKIRGGPHLTEIKIERGAMTSLVDLKLLLCPQLKMLPDGIEHLSTLEELTLDHTAEELVDRVRQRKEMTISHVQRVYIGFVRNGELAFERIT